MRANGFYIIQVRSATSEQFRPAPLQFIHNSVPCSTTFFPRIIVIPFLDLLSFLLNDQLHNRWIYVSGLTTFLFCSDAHEPSSYLYMRYWATLYSQTPKYNLIVRSQIVCLLKVSSSHGYLCIVIDLMLDFHLNGNINSLRWVNFSFEFAGFVLSRVPEKSCPITFAKYLIFSFVCFSPVYARLSFPALRLSFVLTLKQSAGIYSTSWLTLPTNDGYHPSWLAHRFPMCRRSIPLLCIAPWVECLFPLLSVQVACYTLSYSLSHFPTPSIVEDIITGWEIGWVSSDRKSVV